VFLRPDVAGWTLSRLTWLTWLTEAGLVVPAASVVPVAPAVPPWEGNSELGGIINARRNSGAWVDGRDVCAVVPSTPRWSRLFKLAATGEAIALMPPTVVLEPPPLPLLLPLPLPLALPRVRARASRLAACKGASPTIVKASLSRMAGKERGFSTSAKLSVATGDGQPLLVPATPG